ncbi:MAG: LON peptidase substrate-binding domain-containing protein, partial [Verrucomicrobiae bacterium]|nr:LON peptidase substrate-binding domain-containing protein [Verrucomicrobiae bacterium]
MRIPHEVGIMVLPNAVLFPGAVLPLYVFEPRYRRMLADALAGDRMFAGGVAEPHGVPHPVAVVGLIRGA